MRDLDFHGLAEEIGDGARQPEFDTVRRRTVRRRARQRWAVAGGALGMTAVLALGGYAVTGAAGGPVDPGGVSGGPAIPPPARIGWVAAGDANHLYALVNDCGSCRTRLVASEDGGHTWQERPSYATLPAPGPELTLWVLGPRILTVGLPPRLGWTDKYPDAPRKISTDGGRTWRTMRVSETPVASAPAGTRVVDCSMDACELHAVVPSTGTIAPLKTQPPLRGPIDVADVPPDAGIWVRGFDPETRRPAVAVSRDRGKSWTRTVFAEESPAPQAADGSIAWMYVPGIATTDGRTVYATMTLSDDVAHLYRSTDGGATWRRTNPDGQLRGVETASPESFVTADGAQVMLFQLGDTFVFRISSDGRTYEELAGPAKLAFPPTVVDKNHYLSHSGQAIFMSTDGRTWRRLTTP